ncbi:MAG: type II toxin-antitoxin system VapC family toxin [Nocardioidaceae bacterium]|nr:type II toxin-antitoxin system VapC family toxin [Nocardioidaceae bacterium]
MIVLDASAAVDLLLTTERAAAVTRAIDTTVEVHAPELLEPEVLAVVRRWVGRGWIGSDVADRAVAELGDLAVVRHGHASLRTRIWQLRHRCTTYDACYVALAEQLAACLVTTDRRLARAASGLVDVVALG